jgi:hypothetical protein
MTMGTKKELFGIELREYLGASKKIKTRIIDNLVRQTGMHRISIIRAFKRLQMSSVYHPPGKRGRKTYYTHEVLDAVHFIWKSADFCCGELLHPVISERVDIAKKQGTWIWSEEVTRKVLRISVATLKRRIPRWRDVSVRRGISTTTPSAIKDNVPLFEGDWKQVSVGMGQVDTVAHCGGSMTGEFIFSCGYVDVASGWSQYRAQWNKGMIATQESLSRISLSLPFPLSMIHPDCGTEFLNQYVLQWADTMNIDITRSRSYHKNDNGYIEQRNNHIVRKWFGYTRLEHKELVPLMNEFYELLALWGNHFQAQRLCIGIKETAGKRTRKVYEKVGKTPYQRILERDDVPTETKERLMREHAILDPYTLHTELHKRKDAILALNRRLTEERKVTNS